MVGWGEARRLTERQVDQGEGGGEARAEQRSGTPHRMTRTRTRWKNRRRKSESPSDRGDNERGDYERGRCPGEKGRVEAYLN